MDPATAALVSAAYAHADAHPALVEAVQAHRTALATLHTLTEQDGEYLLGRKGQARLTAKEQRVLRTLATARGAVRREDLGRAAWPEWAGGIRNTHTVETHLFRLRQKLAAVGAPAQIVTDVGLKGADTRYLLVLAGQ